MGKVCYYGGLADVSHGEYLGRPMAIKRLRMIGEDSDRIFKVPLLNLVHHICSAFTQRLCREIISWKHLSHRNILPLFGISVSKDPRGFCILTEWMPNGNVIQYARVNPEANRFRLVSSLAVSP
jgi:serine/threonine protein kinase